MYNDRKEKLGIWNYLVYAFIILLIIIIIIVFMSKGSKKKTVEKPKEMVLYSEAQIEKIETDYSESMAANMASFKFNAIDYYKDKLGNEKVDMILTLQDFYDKHFIEELKVDDDKCDSSASKVEVTKKSGEYKLDITLVCGDNKATLDTYLGKYDYCKNSDICEKKIEKSKKNIDNDSTNNPSTVNPSSENPSTVNPKIDEPVPDISSNKDNKNTKYTFYEYVLTPSDKVGSYSNFSNWSKDVPESNMYIDIETKEETETKTEGCTETKEESYISGYNEETYISGYITKKYQVGTHKVIVGTKQVKKNGKVVNQPIYEEQPLYQTKEEPVYATKKTPIYETRQVTVDTCTNSIKYYRYRKFSYKKGINYVKYSVSEDDKNLLDSGYTKTGNKKEF